MRRTRYRWLLVIAMAITACSGQNVSPTASTNSYPVLDPAQVTQGRQVYVQRCASCHGPKAEGAPNWSTPGPDGLYPAPPHDDTGHTWHHSDRVLYESIRDGMNDPLRPGSPLRMPAWGSTLSDSEIRAVISYFKSLWSTEHRQYQWEETLKDFKPTPTPPP